MSVHDFMKVVLEKMDGKKKYAHMEIYLKSVLILEGSSPSLGTKKFRCDLIIGNICQVIK